MVRCAGRPCPLFIHERVAYDVCARVHGGDVVCVCVCVCWQAVSSLYPSRTPQCGISCQGGVERKGGYAGVGVCEEGRGRHGGTQTHAHTRTNARAHTHIRTHARARARTHTPRRRAPARVHVMSYSRQIARRTLGAPIRCPLAPPRQCLCVCVSLSLFLCLSLRSLRCLPAVERPRARGPGGASSGSTCHQSRESERECVRERASE